MTGELVPRRTRAEAQNVETLARLAAAADVVAAGGPGAVPPTIALEPLSLDEPVCA